MVNIDNISLIIYNRVINARRLTNKNKRIRMLKYIYIRI